MERDERTGGLEERYEGYTVYDNTGEKIGMVDDLFVDENEREEYIGVKMGLFGISGTTLIPMEVVRVNERERTIEASVDKDHVKDAPSYSYDEDITPEYEDGIRRHFGLEPLEPSAERGAYGRTAGMDAGGLTTSDTGQPSGSMEDHQTGEQRDRMGDEELRETARETAREAAREGAREGADEGSRHEEGGRGDIGPSGPATGAGTAGEEMTGSGPEAQPRSASGPSDESSEMPRRSDEGEREEDGTTRVWRRIRQ